MSKELNDFKDLLFIVNPVSGNGKTINRFKKVEEYLNQQKVKYKVEYTEYKGHAIKLGNQYKKSKDIKAIIAVGGDGTLNEMINGLYPTNIPIGYIPTGTGNDYARAVQIPLDPILATNKILKGDIKSIDVGKINDYYFMNVASMGFDAEVAKFANQTKFKKISGKLVYVIGVIKALWGFKPKTVSLYVDGIKHEFRGVWLIAVANNQYYGGGMKISPFAENDDGLLNVCIIDNLTRFKLLKLFPSVFSGNHIKYPMVHSLQGSEIEISFDEEVTIQADGEILSNNQLHLKVYKHGLKVI